MTGYQGYSTCTASTASSMDSLLSLPQPEKKQSLLDRAAAIGFLSLSPSSSLFQQRSAATHVVRVAPELESVSFDDDTATLYRYCMRRVEFFCNFGFARISLSLFSFFQQQSTPTGSILLYRIQQYLVYYVLYRCQVMMLFGRGTLLLFFQFSVRIFQRGEEEERERGRERQRQPCFDDERKQYCTQQ